MYIETIKISVHELTLGMHVVKLDREWLGTPFKLQGFRIVSAQELRALEKYCKHVYIDVARGKAPPSGKGVRVVLDDSFEVVQSEGFLQVASKPQSKSGVSALAAKSALPSPAVEYSVETSFEDEMPAGRLAVEQSKNALKDLMGQMSASARGDLEPVREAAAALEASILRNPDPAMLLRALPGTEPFSFRHSVNSAVLGIALARELGLRRQTIHELAMGVLLADIGKLRLPKELLRTTRRLYPRETEIVQKHVPYGVEMATALDGLTPGTIEIIAAHHERFNGSGYPSGLTGGEIPLLGRIAGLVDSFDAITSDRAYSEAIPTNEAVQEMYAATVDVYQRDLVEKLILVLGTYPVGSLVELSDACVAVVVALNRHRRLLPKVIRLSDPDKRAGVQRKVIDLTDAEQAGLSVKNALEADQYGIALPAAAVLGV